MLVPVSPTKEQTNAQLTLTVLQDSKGFSRLVRSYSHYPFRLSPPLQLSSQDQECLYLYLMNTAPGWLAKDRVRSEIHLGSEARLFLTDQAATKVHSMPEVKDKAQVHTEVSLSPGAFLEWLPEPVILYREASLQQTCKLIVAEDAGFVLSEIMVPGRLARGEVFQFRQYSNRVVVMDNREMVRWIDSGQLTGLNNPLTQSPLLKDLPITGTLYVVPPQPQILPQLQEKLHLLSEGRKNELILGVSRLPDGKGLIMRSLSTRASWIREIHYTALNLVRNLMGLPELPEAPK
ncbi:MAG: hypothetical protein HC921_03420 [Synechococcaceae cyanobacterium SM2_3_1]|nr:hypothetical protein [Synechococcaceae cyanobacterium SM2_3_1]